MRAAIMPRMVVGTAVASNCPVSDPAAAIVAGEDIVLDEAVHDLFDKERVAAGAFIEKRDQILRHVAGVQE